MDFTQLGEERQWSYPKGKSHENKFSKEVTFFT